MLAGRLCENWTAPWGALCYLGGRLFPHLLPFLQPKAAKFGAVGWHLVADGGGNEPQPGQNLLEMPSGYDACNVSFRSGWVP